MRCRAILTSIIFALLSTIAFGTTKELYISPSGNDQAKGGKSSPLASLQGAIDKIVSLQSDPKFDKFMVNVEGGEYYLSSTIQIDSRLQKPVEFRGSEKSRSIICGGMQTEKFTPVNDKLWRVYIPESARYGFRFEQIYINGERRFRAQSPNRGEFATIKHVKQIPIDSTNLGRDINGWETLKITPQEPLPFGRACRTYYLSGENVLDQDASLIGEVMGRPLLTFFHKWDTTRRPLQHVEANGTMTIVGRGVYPWNRIDGRSRFIAENDAAFLDAEGEWILSREGWLYYIPCEGETIENTICHIPVVEKFIEISGKDINTQVDGVEFNNIDFVYAAYITPDEGNVQMQAAASISTVIEVNFARNIHFSDCTIAHTGLGGVWFKRGCSDCSVERCHIYDLGAGGVKIGETTIRKNKEEITHHIKLDNNIIQHGGFVFPCAVGVCVFYASDNQVTHNDIADFRYTGISVGWMWGYSYSPAKRNIIEYNHIHHLGWAQLSDMGGVYTLGMSEGTSVSNNVLHDIYSLYYGGWGLYTDEGSSGIRIENNLVYNCKSGGFHQHYGKENLVRNNIFAGQIRTQLEASRVEEHLSFDFSHNIIYYSQGTMCGINWANVGHKSNHNCYFHTEGSDKINFQGLSFEQWQAKGQDRNSVIANPQFADKAAGNFTPQNKEMLDKIGFKVFDYTKAGVYGSPEWKQKAELSSEMKAAFKNLVADYEDKNITDW